MRRSKECRRKSDKIRRKLNLVRGTSWGGGQTARQKFRATILDNWNLYKKRERRNVLTSRQKKSRQQNSKQARNVNSLEFLQSAAKCAISYVNTTISLFTSGCSSFCHNQLSLLFKQWMKRVWIKNKTTSHIPYLMR